MDQINQSTEQATPASARHCEGRASPSCLLPRALPSLSATHRRWQPSSSRAWAAVTLALFEYDQRIGACGSFDEHQMVLRPGCWGAGQRLQSGGLSGIICGNGTVDRRKIAPGAGSYPAGMKRAAYMHLQAGGRSGGPARRVLQFSASFSLRCGSAWW